MYNKSQELFERAQQSIPGGVNSPVRAFRSVGGTPIFIEKAKGARKELYDEMERVRGPGRVSNLFKAYAAFPALAKANFHRLMVLLSQGNLSLKFKEAVMTALAEAGLVPCS